MTTVKISAGDIVVRQPAFWGIHWNVGGVRVNSLFNFLHNLHPALTSNSWPSALDMNDFGERLGRDRR